MSAYQKIIKSITKELSPSDEQEKLIKLLEKLKIEETQQEYYEKQLKKIEDQEKISRDGIRHEDELTSKRLTWMTTVQGFLLTAVGVSLVNGLGIGFIVILGGTGALISFSTLFVICYSNAIELYIRRWQRLQLEFVIKKLDNKIGSELDEKEINELVKDILEKEHGSRINPNAIIVGYCPMDKRNENFSIYNIDENINNALEEFNNEIKGQFPGKDKKEEEPDEGQKKKLRQEILKLMNLQDEMEDRSLLKNWHQWFSPPRALPVIFILVWAVTLGLSVLQEFTDWDLLVRLKINNETTNKIEFNFNSPLEIKVISTPSPSISNPSPNPSPPLNNPPPQLPVNRLSPSSTPSKTINPNPQVSP